MHLLWRRHDPDQEVGRVLRRGGRRSGLRGPGATSLCDHRVRETASRWKHEDVGN
jgi:hypothetical protein